MTNHDGRAAVGPTPIWIAGLTSLILAGPIQASAQQQVTVQPQQGQTSQRTQEDMASCQSAATQSTGYAPSQQQAAASRPSGPGGKRLKGAAAAAVGSSVRTEARGSQYEAWDKADDDRKGDYKKNQAESAARAGAAVGGIQARQGRRETRRHQGQQQQAQAQKASAWDQSYKACLQGRGYAVTP